MYLHTGNFTNRCVGSFEMSCIGRWTTALPNDGGTPRILHGVCVGIMTDFGLMCTNISSTCIYTCTSISRDHVWRTLERFGPLPVHVRAGACVW